MKGVVLSSAVGLAALVICSSQPQRVNAASFNLDFETAPDGTVLDAYDLDSPGGQLINGTTYSTTLGNVGQIWESIGISITTDTTQPIGLFQTNCNPLGGFNNNGFTDPCEIGNNGDNDLATGQGYNPDKSGGSLNPPTTNYDTSPQGNALILEENPGNSVPDDVASQGTVTFNFDRNLLGVVKIGQIAVIDDINATIIVDFLDGTPQYQETIDSNIENDLNFFTVPDGNVDKFSVNFSFASSGTSSGAVSGVVFTEFEPVSDHEVPEPGLLLGLKFLGLSALGGRGIRFIKNWLRNK